MSTFDAARTAPGIRQRQTITLKVERARTNCEAGIVVGVLEQRIVTVSSLIGWQHGADARIRSPLTLLLAAGGLIASTLC